MNKNPKNKHPITTKKKYPCVAILEVRKDIKRIERYSERNKRTNPGPEYSTLKPETSSDSPSAKSKGERLDSASNTTKEISTKCGKKIRKQKT